jgi:hypothetical protein
VAILQALLALISRSLGSILSALFGWAVVALFGQTSPREKMWLSALVGGAAAWPLLLVGVVWPRLAAMALLFLPLPHWIPDWVIRAAWILLAIITPFALGIAVAARSRGAGVPIPGTAPAMGPRKTEESGAGHSPLRDSKLVRLWRGVPITMAIATSFAIVFAAVPLRRLVAIVRRQVDVHVPLVTDAQGYDVVAHDVAVTLRRHGIQVRESRPPWSLTMPGRILHRFGGPGFRAYVPQRLACFRGPRLEVLLYANGLSLRGSERDTAWAHGLLVEALTSAPAYQTFDPGAQDIERQLRSVWAVFRQNPASHAGAARLEARLDAIAREIRDLPVDYDEWQVVYRQALQLDRALRGAPQLMEAVAPAHGPGAGKSREDTGESREQVTIMEETIVGNGTRALPIRELVAQVIGKATLLAKKEVELARTEVKADLESELAALKGLAGAALVLVLGLNMLLVAGVFWLATWLPAWLAALLIGGLLVLVAAIVGYASWSRRVSSPLAVTRRTLKESTDWVKERLA